MPTRALILATLIAASGTSEGILETAIEDFEFGEHAAAATKLRKILEPIQLESKENVIVARQYLGACYHLLGERNKARTQFSMLLALDSSHRLDPAVFSPALVKLFEEVRAETGLALKEPPPPPPPPPARGPPPPPPNVVVQPAPTYTPHSRAFSFIPFGVGQFKNRHPVRGALFAAVPVALFAAAAGTFAGFESLKVETIDGVTGEVIDVRFRPEDVDKANRLQTAYLATFWSGIAALAAGIVEALISYPGDDVAPSDANLDARSGRTPSPGISPFVFTF